MKNKIQQLFYFGIILALATNCLSAQCPLQPFNILGNPDFETYGAPCDLIVTPPDITINGAFNDGCVQSWQAANGTPSICSPEAANGANFLCLGGDPEGISQNVAFCEGQQYKLTINHRSHPSCVHLPLPCAFHIYLANGLSNVSQNDPPGFPSDPSWQYIQMINTTTSWETTTIVFTAGSLLNNQLLFLSEGNGDVFLDKLSLTCEESQFNPDFTSSKICDGKYMFNGVSNNVPGNITTWCWLFDDGTTASGQNVEHTFSNPGAHIVELSVISDQCIGSISRMEHEVVSEMDLSIQKTYTENTFTGELTFLISVHNNLNVAINNIEVSDQLNAGLTLLNPNGFIVNGNTLSRLISLAGQGTANLSFTAVRSCACGPVINCASARRIENGCEEANACVTISGFPALTALDFETTMDLENCFNLQFEAIYEGHGICTEYLWDFGDGTFSTGPSPFHEFSANGLYVVVLKVTTPCGVVEFSRNLEILCYPGLNFTCSCDGLNALNIDAGFPSVDPNVPVLFTSISDTEIPDNTVASIFSPNTLYNSCLAIKGNLLIDNNYDLAIIGGELRMQPGARIIVAAGSKLRLSFINAGSGTERGIHGCEKMWRSIEVQPGGTLVANFNVIQDGEFAFDVRGDLGFISKFTANANTFDRNHVSIRANGGKISLPYPFAQNKFWGTSGLLPQFSSDITNWDANHPYAGLHLNSTSFFVGTESNPGSSNEFDGLRNGILSNRSNLRVYHAKFLNTQGVLAYQESNPNFNNSQGIGIFAKGGERLVVKSSTFDNAPRAVHTEGTALEFKNNLVQNVDVGLWNKPGQGQVINIYDNDIFFRGRGIYVGSPTTTTTVFIDRNDPIESIPSAITDPVGVTINAGPAASTVIKRIANNQFNLKTINDIGIWLNFSGNWRVQDNRVDYLTPAGDAGTGQGISLSGSDFNYLRGNQVYGSGTADKAGFRLQNSDNCTLCCNISDDMFSGMQFHGECNPSFLRHNEIRDHNMGLICFNGARIGDQILGGNTWTGSYGFASAVHGGVQDDIQKSEFYIELPRLGSDYWPLDVNSPALPGLWFRPDLSGMTSTDACELTGCPSLPPPPGTPEPPRYPNSDEYLVASGTYGGSGTYSAMSQFEAERNLYRNIRRGIVLTNNAPNLAQFYTNSTSGTIGKFDQVEWRIEDMWKPSPTIQALLDAYQSTISNLSDNINRIDSLYAYAVTFTDTMLLQNQKIGYFAALEQPTQQWQLLMDNVRMTQQGLVPAITALNNSVPSGDIRVNNRKTLSRIYLETVAVDNFVTTQAQRNDLIAVANQCFLTGGDAVLQARALYAVLVAPLLISDDLLCAGQQRLEADSRNAEQTATRYKASIVPNPAQDQFSVQVEGAAANAMLRVQVIAPNGNIVRDASIQNGQVLSHAFAPGLYICRIYIGKELANVVKLVIIP